MDPINRAYRRLSAAVMIRALRDARFDDERADAARLFLGSEQAKTWTDRAGLQPSVLQVALVSEGQRCKPDKP